MPSDRARRGRRHDLDTDLRMRLTASLVIVLSLVVAACGGAPGSGGASVVTTSPVGTVAPAKAAPPEDLVRAGVVKIGFNPTNAALVSGRDPNTKAPQGVGPDIANELAARLGVKIVWVEYTSAPAA